MRRHNLKYENAILIDASPDKTGEYARTGFKIAQVVDGNTADVLERFVRG